MPEEYTAPVPEGYSDIIYKDGDIEKTLTAGTQLNQDEFANLPNDRQHYAYFGLNDADLDSDGINYTTYIVTTTFDVAGTMYNAGMKVSESVYNDLGSTLQQNLKKVTITPGQFSSSPEGRGKFYYCIEEYKVGEKDQYIQGYTSKAIKGIDNTTYDLGATVPVGTILTYDEITTKTVNYQHGLEILRHCHLRIHLFGERCSRCQLRDARREAYHQHPLEVLKRRTYHWQNQGTRYRTASRNHQFR